MTTLVNALAEKIRTKNNLTKFWLRNAITYHRVPWEDEDDQSVEANVNVKHEHSGTVVKEKETIIEKPKPSNGKSTLDVVKRLAVPAALLLGAGGVGYGLHAWLKDEQSKRPQQEYVDQDYNSVIQWLEDEGEHLP